MKNFNEIIENDELNLCPNIKENCIFNEKHWKRGKPEKCLNCLNK